MLFIENRTLQSLSSSRVFPKRRLWDCVHLLKREFAYQTFIETIAGNHIECELKAVMDLSITACLRLRRRKTSKAFSGIPLFCFNKQWLIRKNSLSSSIPTNPIIAALGGTFKAHKKNSLEVREFVKFLFETVFFVETIHASVCLSEFLTASVEWV